MGDSMTNATILAPAAVLVLWSLIVMLWMTATRFPALKKSGLNIATAPRGARYADVEQDMPAKVNWVSHNFTHLMEQPTLFYALVAVLGIAGDTSSLSVAAAWGYAGFRIAHSLWQGLVNIVIVRTLLFTLGTLCLWVLAVNAIRITLA